MKLAGVPSLVAFVGLTFTLACSCSNRPQSGGDSSAEVAEPAPIPSVLTQARPAGSVLVELGSRPLSFAPLVAAVDASVAKVKAVTKVDVQGRERTLQEGLGTAFIYDPAGYLLTNNHVIAHATEITVEFRDGRDLPARVIGSDARSDVAVLKVEAPNLPALQLGDSDEALVGDWVVAIGNPYGLAHSVSAGILSAKGRTIDDVDGLDAEGYWDFLQTDASINPGNSGGPLLNLKGEVVGINAAIRKNANGIGFAVPINMVKDLIPILLRDGKVRRSALGVIVGDVSPEQSQRLGQTERRGAWVKGLQGAGPADKGGIRVDDVIVAFDGKPIADPNALRWYASIFGVGRTAKVHVLRDGKELDANVTLNELPEQPDP